MTTLHSVLPPSSAARRVACPGSRALEAQYPSEKSPASLEGDAAHWAASILLKGTNTELIKIGDSAPNGELITQEMLDGAVLLVNHVMPGAAFADEVHIEKRINIQRIHPDCWGTPDVWYFNRNTGGLYIFDYKFGHKNVEVFENWQLIEYAAGILDLLEVNGFTDQHINVIFTIVQPRSFHKNGPVREWAISASGLRPYFNTLEQAERDSMTPETMCKPNPECNYCSARHACQALQNSALTAVDMSFNNAAWNLTPEQIGGELRILQYASELLEARITGLEQQALSLILSGTAIPHFTTEQGNGRDCWTKPIEEIKLLGEMFGTNLTKPVELITPKQAIKQGLSNDIIKDYYITPKSAVKLVLIDNKKTREIFEKQSPMRQIAIDKIINKP